MEFTTYLRFVLVLVLVIGLILGLAWAVRRFGLTGALQGSLGRKRRLNVVESATLDGRNRIVLVRRDDVEHLLLIGPNTSQVIERGIPASPSDAATFSAFLPKDKES
jgi:flagellar protein FliO/FliZ